MWCLRSVVWDIKLRKAYKSDGVDGPGKPRDFRAVQNPGRPRSSAGRPGKGKWSLVE